MPPRVRTVQFFCAMAVCLVSRLAAASQSPGSEQLDFMVLKDGAPIGHHHIDVIRDGDDVTVSVKTEIVVTVAYVPVYSFKYDGKEIWRSGRLISLRSTANDDGERHNLFVVAAGDHLDIQNEDGGSTADPRIMPATLWNPEVTKQSVLLNPQTGKPMQISVADLGEESITTRRGPLKTHHFKVSGDLERDVWYAPDGKLVQIRFKARDDSSIQYVLS